MRATRAWGTVLVLVLAGTQVRVASAQPEGSVAPEPAAITGVADVKDIQDLSLEDLLAPKVVVAAKHDQFERDAAASATVISRADLDAFGWRDFQEAVATLAGFYTTDSQDTTFFGVRGISRKGDYNGRVLILVDGHQQQEPWSKSAYPELIGLDATLIDHIEVLRGPSSALYGSLGFLAIINIVTLRPSDKQWAKGTFELLNANGFRGALHIGHKFDNGVEFGINLSGGRNLGQSHTYPDVIDNSLCPMTATGAFELPQACHNGKSPAAADASTTFASYAHISWKGLKLIVSYQYYEKHQPTAPYASLFGDTANRYSPTHAYAELSYTVGRTSLVQGQARVYVDNASYRDDYAYSGDNTAAGRYVFYDHIPIFWTGAEAKALIERNWRDKYHMGITAGGEVWWMRSGDTSGIAGQPPPTVELCDHQPMCKTGLLYGALYAQGEFSYRNKLFITAGVRGDFSDTFGQAVSPRAGIVGHPYETGTLKLLYGHGIIQPAWYEAYFKDGISTDANPYLTHEYADNFELVFEQQLLKSLTVTATTFYILGRNLIQENIVCENNPNVAPTPDTCPNGGTAFQKRLNTDKFDSYGGELSIAGKAGPARIYANYSFAHARDGNGQPVFNSPEHIIKAGVSYPLWRQNFFVGWEGRVLSPRRYSTDPTVTDTTGWTFVMNAFLMWKDLPKNFMATIKVYNITGQTWYEPSQTEITDPILRIPHEGATAVLRLTYAL